MIHSFFIDYNLYLLFRFHDTFNVKTRHFCLCVCTYRNTLLEVPRKLPRSIICYINRAFLSWCYWPLFVTGNCTSTTCHYLVDNQRCVTNICESKCDFLNWIVFRERSEIVSYFIEFYIRFPLSH